MNILERDNPEEYENKKKECPNVIKRILYHYSEINPINPITSDTLNYSENSYYGKGFYFSDMIDYIASFYSMKKNDPNYGKIPPYNSVFSFVASEIFYDQKKKSKYTDLLRSSLFSSNSSYSSKEIQINIKNKVVEPNGIQNIKVLGNCNKNEEKNFNNTIIGNEYIVSEKYQIFPIYSISLKRNEYFVIYRDPNFGNKNEYSQFLLNLKNNIFDIESKINIYYETSTEEALKFVYRRKFCKIIFITSIGKDLSGKRFIEVARKILGFDAMVLFFSNNRNHFDWIQDFNNFLYTNKLDIFFYYINNYNENGLKKLKKKVENDYNIKLKQFSFDFLLFPWKKDDSVDYLTLNNNDICNYIRHVYIYSESKEKYLIMENNGKVIISEEKCPWDVILYENEITLFSNEFYLDIDSDKETVIGYSYMKRWDFEINENNNYYFINKEKEKNNILSIQDEEIKVNMNKVGKTELFKLIDIPEK